MLVSVLSFLTCFKVEHLVDEFRRRFAPDPELNVMDSTALIGIVISFTADQEKWRWQSARHAVLHHCIRLRRIHEDIHSFLERFEDCIGSRPELVTDYRGHELRTWFDCKGDTGLSMAAADYLLRVLAMVDATDKQLRNALRITELPQDAAIVASAS